MKKLICILLAILMHASLAACGGTQSGTGEAKADTSSKAEEKKTTSMSSTMIYSEVQNMMTAPDDYIGKKVKMAGQFNVAEVGDNRYFACLIKDATACCASGVEFVWAGEHSYPGDYPEENAPITVTGTFTTYKEGEATYCQLKDADLQF